MLLKGKTALVYGAGGAVGGAVAQAFAREGAHVILSGRTASKLERIATLIRDANGSSELSVVDALDEAAVAAQWKTLETRGPIGVMFNSVDWGPTQGVAVVESSYALFSGAIGNALKTWFLTGTAAARHMAAHGGGTIVGITANVGRVPEPMVNGFGVACAAVEHFLRQLAIENGPKNVRACFVRSAGSGDAPGVVEAFKLRASEKGTTFEAVLAEAGKNAPLRRMPWLAEVADAATLLASNYARGMTATLANVTCGAAVD